LSSGFPPPPLEERTLSSLPKLPYFSAKGSSGKLRLKDIFPSRGTPALSALLGKSFSDAGSYLGLRPCGDREENNHNGGGDKKRAPNSTGRALLQGRVSMPLSLSAKRALLLRGFSDSTLHCCEKTKRLSFYRDLDFSLPSWSGRAALRDKLSPIEHEPMTRPERRRIIYLKGGSIQHLREGSGEEPRTVEGCSSEEVEGHGRRVERKGGVLDEISLLEQKATGGLQPLGSLRSGVWA